jgi:hypothetical protein
LNSRKAPATLLASNGFTEEGSDSFVSLIPLHRTKYIVLHHGQREAGNLRGEVEALAFTEAMQLLTIVISIYEIYGSFVIIHAKKKRFLKIMCNFASRR